MAEYGNAVTMLKRVDPAFLDSLLQEFPGQSDLIKSSRQLGPVPPAELKLPEDIAAAASASAREERRKAIIKFLTASLGSERDQVEELLYKLRGQMVLVARTKLFGAIISAGSGALSAVFSYADGGQSLVAMVSALVAMAGGLSAIFADYFDRSPSGIKIDSAEEYGKLVEIRRSIGRIASRVARDSFFEIDEQELETISNTVDEFAGEIVRLKFA
jgi:hypothetical protein